MYAHTLNAIPATDEQRIADAIGTIDGDLVRGVLKVMRDEVFMSTLENLDDIIFRLGAEQARAILFGRIARPYIGVEILCGQERELGTDGHFAETPTVVARYPSALAALRACEHAFNRRPGAAVMAKTIPYQLPI
jgi:hypothetical protein